MVKYHIMITKFKIHKIWAFLLAMILLLTSMNVSSFAYTSQYGTVTASNVNVRSGPGTGYGKVAKLQIGNQVVVDDEVEGSDGRTWCNILYDGGTKQGYILKDYVSTANPGSSAPLSDAAFEQMLSNQGFPESYKVYLRALHKEYPNWTFKAVHTGLDWTTALAEESVVGRNLVPKASVTSWKSTADGAFDWNSNYWPGFDGDSWQAASTEIIAYYMDPRNFLDSTYVFQFLDQTYNSNIHNAAGVEAMVKGTFMESKYTGALAGATSVQSTVTQTSSSGSSSSAPSSLGSVQLIGPGQSSSAGNNNSAPGSSAQTSPGAGGPSAGSGGPGMSATADTSGATYVDMIMKAAEQSGVNPYVLTSMIIQEQGKNGASGSISGSYGGYSGVYNFYNVEAYASNGMNAVTRGLWWASQSGTYDRPWNSKEKAIVGGAKFYGEGYVKKSQNTFYLKKFNVSNTNTYKHQYMTNVQAAAGEGFQLAKAYTADIKTAAHDFEIPVFKNMPEQACAKPTGDGSPNNKLYGLGVDGFSLTPTFDKDILSYDLIVDSSVASVSVSAATIDSTASVKGTGTVNLTNGTNKINVIVTAQNGTARTYTINVVRQNGGPTYTQGIGGVQTGPGISGGPGAGSSSGNATNVVISSQTTTSNSNKGTAPGSNSGSSSKKPTVVLIGPGGQ